MRVLHVSAYFAPAFVYGGPPRTIFGLTRALRDASIDVRVVTTTANGADDLAAARDGTTYGGVPVRYCERTFPRFLWNAQQIGGVLAEEAEAADLIHIHGLWHAPGWIAAAAARRTGVPYVLSPRGMLEPAARSIRSWRKRAAFVAFERRNLAGAARLHATAAAEAARLAVFADPARIVTIPNGVDLDAPSGTSDIRSHAGIAPGEPIVLFLGRVHPIKRLDLLIDAVAAVRQRHPDVHLVIAGPDERQTLSGLAPHLDRLGRAVHCVGYVDDAQKAAWLRAATLVGLCSDSENFGTVVAEALAARRPVVVTRTCPWPEVERAGCGFWIDQTAEAIADAIQQIIADPDGARAMGERGRTLVESTYAWPVIGRAMARCYEDVLGACDKAGAA